ncbi:MAG TPA: DMT family transporter [Nitrososphaerales archaeon]|nr:DMT family transporter [Nitrososphaerales archaeon]
MRKRTGPALVQTALAAVLWGTSFPVISVGLKGGLDPRTFVFLRFALAAPLMLLFTAATGRKTSHLLLSKEVWIIGAFNAAGFLCQFVGQQYTAASIAALLINLSVVMAAAGGAIFLGERFGVPKGVGIALAVVGTVLLTTNGNLGTVGRGQLLGDFLYLGGAVSWASYIVYAKKKTDQLNWDPVSLAAGIVTVTAILVMPVALTAGTPRIDETSLWAIVYTGLVNTTIPFVLYQQGLRYLTASSSAVILTLEIVVAVGVSVVYLGEVLSVLAWVGTATILSSIFMVSGLELRKQASTAN